MRQLRIQSCAISDDGLRVLGRLPELSHIQLHGKIDVTDDGVAALAPLSKLEVLILPDSQIKGAGLRTMTGFVELRALSLARAPLDDRGLAEIAKLNQLQQLDLSGISLTDRGLAEFVGKLPWLTRLDLSYSSVTDTGLLSLQGRPRLRELNVLGTNLTLNFVSQLLDDNRHLRVWALDPQQPQSRSGISIGSSFQPIDSYQALLEP